MHYIVSLSQARLELAEYQRLSDQKCEVQIRSILQHAWAEIEHDLGYKSPTAVPRVIRRRFSRLAGLLEIADEEFVKVREELAAYQDEIRARLDSHRSETVLIDKESVKAFILQNKLARSIAEEIARATHFDVLEHDDIQDFEASRMATALSAAGYETLDRVEADLQRHRPQIIAFAQAYLGGHRDAFGGDDPQLEADDEEGAPQGGVGEAISVMYLCYVTVLSTRNLDVIRTFFERSQFASNRPVGELEELASLIPSVVRCRMPAH